MYSLVLMTAMTAGPDAPEFNGSGVFPNLFHGGSCSGSCSGNCYGNYAPRYSCYGGGCSSSLTALNCSGATSCSGCSGSTSASNNCSGSSSGFLSRFRKMFDRGGNCCGGSCQGCTGAGSGYGCTGSAYAYGCCGGSMAYSCFGSSPYSCFGGPAVAYTPTFNAGLSCQGGMAWPAPPPVFDTAPVMPDLPPATIPPQQIPYAPPEAAPGTNPQNTGFRPTPGSALVSNGPTARATVVVRLPIDARLFADAKPLALVGAERKFVSPELPVGQEFVYRFRAEYERDGETVSVTKKVAVRAGAVLSVEFTDLTAKAAPAERAVPERPANANTAVAATPTSNPAPATPAATVPGVPAFPTVPAVPQMADPNGAGDRATITVKLPPGATLFVDDRKSPSSEPIRQFSTPPLPTGRDYSYLMRAEIVRNGQTETFTQKVPFRAGERVDVDFTGTAR
ncbi:Uncharacterized protein OS=Pirellula staleyi (strain ATCC 27377 / DSM 6068 / ICPB 4128) GN=Psta_2893 PE=4 SV=1 [Gemmataceae bacterium]|nr:Uncharacterized protein OS=Pirellula staleyi (strain ATCC 27377 / DSM 6068 / ICPB 4128) GN=Psta_2893 PE=4 SV=1 [Gemmataceae bacterium]VTT99668.1 Uncharacterized protein OS=Pirellula staleyi (strain ATCC 27377 / DSM 6068 / ICPB 4128) GN=Psta_2893 PE=4 SV=1 [Gemmataceae bacterium]